MEFLEAHLDLLLDHLLIVVFVAFLIEAAGIPFPTRIIMVAAATLAGEPRDLAALVAAGTAGALIGDHVPYAAGALMGPRILALYCRITLGSSECVEKTVRYFTRFGSAAILLSRLSQGVRLFAAALSGCGHISYRRFLGYDCLGTILYTTLWAVVGYLVGEQVAEFLGRPGKARLEVLVVPLATASLLAYRLWKRRRHGAATAAQVREDAACLPAGSSGGDRRAGAAGPVRPGTTREPR